MRRTSEPIAKIVELHFGKDVINNHFLSIIGYGSGVISQTKNEDEFLLNTIDLLIEVPNAEIFHKQWLKAKPKDYRGLSRWLGHPYLSLLMRWVFPIHFNHIQVGEQSIKYGIVESSVFRKDLSQWNLLILAGRLHKPVIVIKGDGLLDRLITKNREMALGLALLLFSNQGQLPIEIIWEKINLLSYDGDIRMKLGLQSLRKTQKMAMVSSPLYHEIYQPLLYDKKLQITRSISLNNGNRAIKITYSQQLVQKILQKENVPANVYNYIFSELSNSSDSLANQMLLISRQQALHKLKQRIRQINFKASCRMTLYNFLSSSPLHSLKYILVKLAKKRK